MAPSQAPKRLRALQPVQEASSQPGPSSMRGPASSRSLTHSQGGPVSTLAAPPGWTVSPAGAKQRHAGAPAPTPQLATPTPQVQAARPTPPGSTRSRRHRPSRQVQPEPAWAATYSNPMADTDLPSQYHRRGPGAEQAGAPQPSRRPSSRAHRQAEPRHAEARSRSQPPPSPDSALLSPVVAAYARRQRSPEVEPAAPELPAAPAGEAEAAGQHLLTSEGYITGVQAPQLPPQASAEGPAPVGPYRVSSRGYIMGPRRQVQSLSGGIQLDPRGSKPQPHSSWAYVPRRSPPPEDPPAVAAASDQQQQQPRHQPADLPEPTEAEAQPSTPDLPSVEVPAAAQMAEPAAPAWSDARAAEAAVPPPATHDRAPDAVPQQDPAQGVGRPSWHDARELDSSVVREAAHSSRPVQQVGMWAVLWSCAVAAGSYLAMHAANSMRLSMTAAICSHCCKLCLPLMGMTLCSSNQTPTCAVSSPADSQDLSVLHATGRATHLTLVGTCSQLMPQAVSAREGLIMLPEQVDDVPLQAAPSSSHQPAAVEASYQDQDQDQDNAALVSVSSSSH